MVPTNSDPPTMLPKVTGTRFLTIKAPQFRLCSLCASTPSVAAEAVQL